LVATTLSSAKVLNCEINVTFPLTAPTGEYDFTLEAESNSGCFLYEEFGAVAVNS